MIIDSIHISARHVYFGHHGREAGSEPTVAVQEVEAVEGFGLRGDRFFGHGAGYKGQVTLHSSEVVSALRGQFGLPGLTGAELRRNVLVSGVDLSGLIGRRFWVQGVRLEGTEECRPCPWMDRAVAPGAEAWLRGRGGLRCRILSTGVLRVGEAGLRVEEGGAGSGVSAPRAFRAPPLAGG